MRIVFRADSSHVIGTGHVMRCLTLAAALRARGVAASFVSRAHSGNLCDLIETLGFPVSRLSIEDSSHSSPSTSGPEAAERDWERDAAETRDAIEREGGERPAWLVVDHYGLDRRFEGALRASVDRVFVIDDMANREHDCDLLLDQNLVANLRTRYDGKVPGASVMLLGPDYALLQRDYAEAHGAVALRAGPIRRLLVSFGGADRDNLTGRVLGAFLELGRADVQMDVVFDATGPHAESIRRQAAGGENVTLHSGLPSLAALMASADLAVGAGGATTWERLCTGLPTLAVIMAENQLPIVTELEVRGLVRSLGRASEATAVVIRRALSELLESGLPAGWSRACQAVVDGRGTERVVAALGAANVGPLRARRMKPMDEALVLEWANDPETRRNAFSSRKISVEEHHRWFTAQLGDAPSFVHYILETGDGMPLGQVRFQQVEQEWEVHYSMAPRFRGQRLGAPMLGVALDRLRADEGSSHVFGQVKEANHPSRRVFETLGFSRRCRTDEGVVIYERQA